MLPPVARRQMEEAFLVHLPARLEPLAGEGATAAAARGEEGPTTRVEGVEIAATLGDDARGDLCGRACEVGSLLES